MIDGTSLMWIPARLTVPPAARRAARPARARPAGANTTARSHGPAAAPRRRRPTSRPSSRARSRWCSPRVITTTSQPQCCSTCSARWADAPNPSSATRSPGCTSARAQRAVPDHARAQQRRGLEVAERGGSWTAKSSGTVTRVGVATVDRPTGELGRDAEVLLTAHGRTRRCRTCGGARRTPTRSPGARRCNPPRARRPTPTTWCPGTTGRCGGRGRPRRRGGRCGSTRTRRPRTRTSPGPGSGSGRSTGTSGRDATGAAAGELPARSRQLALTGRRTSPQPLIAAPPDAAVHEQLDVTLRSPSSSYRRVDRCPSTRAVTRPDLLAELHRVTAHVGRTEPVGRVRRRGSRPGASRPRTPTGSPPPWRTPRRGGSG